MALFLVGGIVIVVSAVRLGIFINTNGATDFSWVQYTLGTVSVVECAVAVICASVPALKPLIVRIFPRFGSSGRGTASNAYGNTGTNTNTKSRATKGPEDMGTVTYNIRGGEDDVELIGRDGQPVNEKAGKEGGIQVVMAVAQSESRSEGSESGSIV